MFFTILVLSVLFVSLPFSPPSFAQDNFRQVKGVKKLVHEKGRIDIEVDQADLVELLGAISRVSGVEIEVYEGVEGKVTHSLTGALVQSAVKQILREAKQENWVIEYESDKEEKLKLNKIMVVKRSPEYEKAQRETLKEKIKNAEEEHEKEFIEFSRKMNAMDNRVFNALEEFVDPETSKRKRKKLKGYLDTFTPTLEDKEVLKEALFAPKYGGMRNTLALAILHAMQARPEKEKDREYLVKVFEDWRIGPAWLLYAAAENWDDRYYEPLADRYLRQETPSWSVIDLFGEAGVKAAAPLIEEALYHPDSGVRGSAYSALRKFSVGDPEEEARIEKIRRAQEVYYVEKERQHQEETKKLFEEAFKRRKKRDEKRKAKENDSSGSKVGE
jgi:hypothetical protein